MINKPKAQRSPADLRGYTYLFLRQLAFSHLIRELSFRRQTYRPRSAVSNDIRLRIRSTKHFLDVVCEET